MTSYLIHKLCINLRWKYYKMKRNLIALKQSCKILRFLSYGQFDIVGLSLVWNGLFFSYDIPVQIQLVTFLLRFNISELSIVVKAARPFFWYFATSLVRSVVSLQYLHILVYLKELFYLSLSVHHHILSFLQSHQYQL